MKRKTKMSPLAQRLARAVREMKSVERGTLTAGRVTSVSKGKRLELPTAAARTVQARARLGLTQEQFAALLGVSVATLRNWEQGRREPDRAARVLIAVAELEPKTVLAASKVA
jgi:putative transcriptional regulator